MADARLYVAAPLEPGELTLSAEQSHHARASRRLSRGDVVILFDGAGREGRGQIVETQGAGLRVTVAAVTPMPFDAPLRLTLGVAFPKGSRQDVIVEKCTELGIAALWPVRSARSVAKPSNAALRRLRRKTIEACKQSRRAWLPEICDPLPFEEVLIRRHEFDHAFIAGPAAETWKPGMIRPRASVIVLIGPEGGFDPREWDAATASGFSSLTLASTILRTETAAIAAAAQLLRPGLCA